MHQKEFVDTVLHFIGDWVIEFEESEEKSVSLNLIDCNGTIGGIPLGEYIEIRLKEEGFTGIQFFYGDGNWMTIYYLSKLGRKFPRIDIRRDESKRYQKEFVATVLHYLGNMVIEAEEYGGNNITLHLVRSDISIGGKPLSEYIKGRLEEAGFTGILFSYGDDNWMTIHYLTKEERIKLDVNVSVQVRSCQVENK